MGLSENYQTCKRWSSGELYGIRPGTQCRQGVPVPTVDPVSKIRSTKERGITTEQIKRVTDKIRTKYGDLNSPDAQREFSDSLDKLKPRTSNYQSIITVGREKFQDKLQQVSSLMGSLKGGNSDLVLKLAQSKRNVDNAKSEEELSQAKKKHEEYQKIFESFQEAQKVMESIKNSLISRGDLQNSSDRAKDVNIESGLDNKKLRSVLQTLNQITNNQVDTLEKIYSSRDRPYAAKPRTPYPGEEKDLTGRINLGNTVSRKQEAALWHEFGHHIEYSIDEYREAAYQWMRSRVTGSLTSLNSLVKTNRYESDEKAYPGNFGLGAYVGKYISSRNTEVISMGLERFSSPASMVEFYQKDPEHFLLVLGILSNL
jgi:hypothetical protein